MYDFTYRRPANLAEATAFLRGAADARPLSGGQTLLPVMRARLAAPSDVIDVSQLSELHGISEQDGRLIIGAAETHAAVASNAVVQFVVPALSELAGGIGDVQVRHRGTIGGSVANNDPAACYPSGCLALDAEIVTDRRRIAAADFFTGMFSTALEPDELVTALSFPKCDNAYYLKFHNPASRFALIGIFAAHLSGETRIAVTGSGTGVFRWREAEAQIDTGGARDFSQTPLDASLFTGDLHGSADYRQHLVRVLSARALDHLR
ncbi:FAD binding domain-containing protein [Sphingosinicella microcystinivorans]|uniref:Carbon monoxide dehydrogenase n=1 Tax=Sphingosinicella microcystinivorans TaxID=335406 RepID=A0AAD1D927_SPHMI|nr:xanthine dehydrogenase family protein subunit M [Sphingosinicella microcystinivorans]RKS86298.1 carbon-monoxide dehydrogenase medium subunit [Sphingosinicella microcystinivorans]BBE35657.1 carbon monoxide dehydrogenase [Sphingosinicella microcystinivorans]